MTIKVTISHDQPTYPKSIRVTKINDGTNLGSEIVLPGETTTQYVHAHQALIVSEVNDAPELDKHL